jgi:sodium pump decarboxylase gamma subunit
MNIEAFSYTVLSAILGILIVFAFLGFLCLFMIVLKRVVDGNPVKIKTAVTSAAAASGTAVSAADESDWITAAVAAYLEEEDSPRSAMSWLPAENEKLDPWVSTPRVQKTFSGV